MLTISLAHLLGRGVRVESHEAVAIAQELLDHPCGIPTPENIQLASDGSASCIGTGGVPAVADVAQLLLTLLPPGTPNVPAPLRYAIARGLGAVEAPPFSSVRELSSALKRFEKGASRDVITSLLQRGARPRAIAAPTVGTSATVTPGGTGPAPVAPPPRRVSPRPTLVVRNPAPAPNEPAPAIAAARPTSRSSGAPRKHVFVQASRRWGLRVAAAVVASFAVGFMVGDGMTSLNRAPRPTSSASVSRTAPPSSSDLRVHTKEMQPKGETERLLDDASVPPETLPRPATAPTGRIGTESRATVERSRREIGAVQAVHIRNANAFSPSFASDGSAIFFHTGRPRDARSDIEVVGTDPGAGAAAGDVTIVDDGSRNYHAQPSPDGRFVAFDSDRDGERSVYVANRDGSQVRRFSGTGHAAVPTWSRNSRWLAYIRREVDRPDVWNLWVQPIAGGTARRVTNHRYGQTWAASWFPDDRRIAYSHEDALIVMDLQTRRTTRYPSPVKGQLVRTPAVSPDGTKIIFQVFRRGAWVLDLADRSMTHVLTDPTAEEFAWSPDGRQVAFHTHRNGRWAIYVLSRS